MAVVIHLMFGHMFCHIFSSYHLSPAPQMLAHLNVIMPLNSVVISSSLTSHLHVSGKGFPLVGRDQTSEKY